MGNVLLVISTALISGLLATLITLWWQRRSKIYDNKMEVFKTLMSYRYMVSSEPSVRALNSIDIVFYKDKKVREALKNFLDETAKDPKLSPDIAEKHLKLLEVMSTSLKLGDIKWDDIKHVYYPAGLSDKIQEEAMLRKIQIQNATMALPNIQEQHNTPSKEQFNQQMVAQLLPELLKNPASLKNLLDIAKEYGGKPK